MVVAWTYSTMLLCCIKVPACKQEKGCCSNMIPQSSTAWSPPAAARAITFSEPQRFSLMRCRLISLCNGTLQPYLFSSSTKHLTQQAGDERVLAHPRRAIEQQVRAVARLHLQSAAACTVLVPNAVVT